jgi:transcription initiation factor TFIIH subunit 4
MSLDNPLQTAVLNLFVNMKSRFPNLVTGTLARDSIRRALTNGITADQVRAYLRKPCPQIRLQLVLSPETGTN